MANKLETIYQKLTPNHEENKYDFSIQETLCCPHGGK